jgi:hypothetical protein
VVPVFIAGVLLFITLLIGPLLVMVWRELQKQARWTEATRQILASGVSAPAQIRTVGPSKLGRHVFTIELEVQPDTGESPFAATVDTLVPPYASGAIAPGREVRVRFSPADRAVAIDLQAMGYTASL